MTQPTREEALAHFGVKGMRWGVRNTPSSTSTKTSTKKRRSTKKKAAIGVSVLAVGAVVTAAILGKHGKLPIENILRRDSKSDLWSIAQHDVTDRGAKKVKALADTSAFKKLMKEFDADIAEAHKEQTTWMLRNTPNYNPRANPYLPRSEFERLRTG